MDAIIESESPARPKPKPPYSAPNEDYAFMHPAKARPYDFIINNLYGGDHIFIQPVGVGARVWLEENAPRHSYPYSGGGLLMSASQREDIISKITAAHFLISPSPGHCTIKRIE